MAKKKKTKAKASAKKATKKVAKKVAKKKAAKKVAKKKVAKKTAAKKSVKASSKKTTKKTVKKTTKKAVAKPAGKKKAAAPKKKKKKAAAPVSAIETSDASTSMPSIGSAAPEFSLAATDGHAIDLASFKNRSNVVLYFYPKDDTPGCTVEACEFRDDYNTFAGTDTVVLGVSPDDVESHGKFTDKFSLPFPLLADIGAKLAKQYGVWVEKNMYGNKKMGIQRATFLIDKTGSIAAVWPKVKAEGHSKEVLAKLQSLK